MYTTALITAYEIVGACVIATLVQDVASGGAGIVDDIPTLTGSIAVITPIFTNVVAKAA